MESSLRSEEHFVRNWRDSRKTQCRVRREILLDAESETISRNPMRERDPGSIKEVGIVLTLFFENYMMR
jgi:hypothetical protein